MGFGSLLGRTLGGGLGGLIGGDKGESAGRNIGSEIGSFLNFAKGGRVPGVRGKPVKAVIHSGEIVLPVGVAATKTQKAAIRKRGGKI
jgi:hypothetical protein